MEQKTEFVRLSTWWIRGEISDVSPDETLMVVRYIPEDENEYGTTLLVEFPTGKIRAEIPNSLGGKFNEDGSLIAIFGWPKHLVALVEATTGSIRFEIEGNFASFSPDGKTLVVWDWTQNPLTRLVDILTGKIRLEIEGEPQSLYQYSPDGSLIVIQDRQANKTHLIEINTGNIRAEVPSHYDYSFNENGTKLAVMDRELQATHIVDVPSGQILDEKEVFGFRYPHIDTPSEALGKQQEKDRSTLFQKLKNEHPMMANVVDEDMITIDGKFLILYDDAEDKLTLIDLIKASVLAQFSNIYGDYRYYAFTNDSLFLIIERTRKTHYQIVHASTGRTIGIHLETYPHGLKNNIIHLSNGLTMDFYGLPQQKLEHMPPPRPHDEFAIVNQKEAPIYESPRTLIKTWYKVYHYQILNVLGRYGDEWAYVAIFSSEIPTKLGWVQTKFLNVIESWDEAPELDPDDPMGSLKAASAKT